MTSTFALVLAATVCVAPAVACADSRSVLEAAPQSVRQVFTVDDEGLIHQPSGLRCPTAISDAVHTGEPGELSGVLEGGVAGAVGENAVHCVYSAKGRTVAYLSFSRAAEPIGGEPIDAGWCKALPKALALDMGPAIVGLSGQRKYEAPHRLTEMSIAGLPTFACSWSRPPVYLPIVISMVMATQRFGWTATAIHTPPAPPGLNGYSSGVMRPSFFLTSLRLLDMAMD